MFRHHEALRPAALAGRATAPLWGNEGHVRELLGSAVTDLTAQRRTVRVSLFASPEDFRDCFKTRYRPTIAAYSGLAGDPNGPRRSTTTSPASPAATTRAPPPRSWTGSTCCSPPAEPDDIRAATRPGGCP